MKYVIVAILEEDMSTPTDDAIVINAARAIVSQPTPHYSYVDIGDALVNYLRGSLTMEDTLDTLGSLAKDYERLRAR